MIHALGDTYYTIPEAAFVLNVTPGALYRLSHQGLLETLRLHGRHYVTLDQVRTAATRRNEPKPRPQNVVKLGAVPETEALKRARAFGVPV